MAYKGAYYKSVKHLDVELERATKLVYPAMAIALREKGWSDKRLDTTCTGMREVLENMGNDENEDKSLIQLCDEEVGIELMCESSDKHWYELPYLFTDNWEAYLEKHNGKVQKAWLIAVKQAQKKWVIPMMYATVFVALYRKYHFTHEWLTKLYIRMDEIIHEVNSDTVKMSGLLAYKTGLRFISGNEIRFERIKE